ncbi:DUF1207 domain-containing protein [Crenothrix sp.]|uniref:DUF1207 domain-containing protein n=1 Tax=Crenothrix sp. TaxID=3100433 RepID=UPI00374CB5E2
MRYLRFMAALSVMLVSESVYATTADDSYIAGYAAGMLKQNLNLDMPSLIVKDGVITVPVGSLAAADQSKAVELLSQVPGVKGANVAEISSQQSTDALTQPVQVAGDKAVSSIDPTVLQVGWFPSEHLFKPLLADPRWTHFSVAYHNYQNNTFNGNNIASVSFGETIPFYRNNLGKFNAQWEVGLQGGVFSDFNLDAPSVDLINTDFIGALYTSVRAGHFSAFGRLYHQSSHLGDEFLLSQLNTQFQRVNLSYEGVDLRLSYEFPYGVRIYGGGGGIFDRDPSTLRVWSTQAGIEFRSPWVLDFAAMRPIVAVDIKNRDQNNWNTDVSARAGVQFDNSTLLGRRFQLLVEYYNGYSPSGQFYKSKIEYIGLGAHYHF